MKINSMKRAGQQILSKYYFLDASISVKLSTQKHNGIYQKFFIDNSNQSLNY